MKKIISIPVFLMLSALSVQAKQYPVIHPSDFGVKPDLTEIQTGKIQMMIDSVSEKGGGTINFPSGTYITGSIELKSGVCLNLEKGALILGSTSPYDYRTPDRTGEPVSPNARDNSALALIVSNGAHDIAITGKGTIDGRGRALALAIDSLHHKGVLIDPHYNAHRNRPNETARPKLMRLSRCEGVVLKDVSLRNSACWGVTLELCSEVVMENLDVCNRAYWNNDGIDVTDCRNVRISGCRVNSADDGICLKSYYPGHCNDSITITDCRIRSSASAIKFGTASHGGFRNIVIDNIDIRDTYRSAIAIESVDGGFIRNIRVTGIKAKNTGNAIFIRLGHRSGAAPGSIENVYIGHMKVSIPFGRPDEKYDMRGPNSSYINNPIPSSIVGIPGACIENVTIEDVDILYPGRASKGFAYVPLWRMDSIGELADKYPEFSMFGELPCWGFFIRHARNITFKDVRLRLKDEDFRQPFALDDATSVKYEGVKIVTKK